MDEDKFANTVWCFKAKIHKFRIEKLEIENELKRLKKKKNIIVLNCVSNMNYDFRQTINVSY